MGISKETGIWDLDIAERRHKFDPSLAVKIASLYQPTRTADIGCGKGEYCKFFKDAGFSIVHGYEGTQDIKKIAVYDDIFILDLTKRRWVGIDYDFVLSLEVGEHIPKKFEHVFIENILRFVSKDLILSWAIPGQGGAGHFNEQSNEYVISKFVEGGLVFNEERSKELRDAASLKWFRNTVLCFRR